MAKDVVMSMGLHGGARVNRHIRGAANVILFIVRYPRMIVTGRLEEKRNIYTTHTHKYIYINGSYFHVHSISKIYPCSAKCKTQTYSNLGKGYHFGDTGVFPSPQDTVSLISCSTGIYSIHIHVYTHDMNICTW